MWITQDEAVVIFARYCRARFGKSASRRVRAKASSLQKRGDLHGHQVWNKVADELEGRTAARASTETPRSSQERRLLAKIFPRGSP